MKRFKQYLTEESTNEDYASALQAVHGSTPSRTGQGMVARANRDPYDITRDEARALRKAIDASSKSRQWVNKPTQALHRAAAEHFDVPLDTIQYALSITEESTKDYIKSLQLKLSKDDLTDAQLKDFATRSKGIPNSPAQISAIADIDAMSPNHLEQIINHKRVHVFMKHRARQRLSGKWK